jgi:hypothetical protein
MALIRNTDEHVDLIWEGDHTYYVKFRDEGRSAGYVPKSEIELEETD